MSTRPLHLRARSVGLVFAGGATGTAVRAVLSEALPARAGVPWTILAVNVVGAFLLGLLLQTLAGRGPDEGRRQDLRLLLGTGVLGGFTTYSALADDAGLLLLAGRPLVGVGYALLTLLLGLAAAAAGLRTADVLGGRR